MSDFELRKTEAYFTDLLAAIPKAHRRITIVAMTGLWGGRMNELQTLLLAAAQRGVTVRLVFDIYSKLYIAERYKGWGGFRRRQRETEALNEELRASGAEVIYIQKIGLNPFRRRCHVKLAAIDDHAYTFGGINFHATAFDNADYMFRSHDAALARWLHDLGHQLAHGLPAEDIVLNLDASHWLLYDAGVPQKSVIYRRACELAAEATKIYYVSQMAPSGTLAKLLNATENISYFCRPSQPHFPSNVGLFADQHRYHTQNHYKRGRYLHAKFMLFEMKDGTKALVSGSNNFSWRGIAYGTKEIAMYSTDVDLWNQLYHFMQEEIA
jgi:phosphatidylserine/phosphatidylglycerophosphate/cardiolipin synthase-like enzyme